MKMQIYAVRNKPIGAVFTDDLQRKKYKFVDSIKLLPFLRTVLREKAELFDSALRIAIGSGVLHQTALVQENLQLKPKIRVFPNNTEDEQFRRYISCVWEGR